jgi:hypothetical protein
VIEPYCLNTNICSYLETSGGESPNVYLNVVQFFNASVNKTPVAAKDSCFHALVSNMCCSIGVFLKANCAFLKRRSCPNNWNILGYFL